MRFVSDYIAPKLLVLGVMGFLLLGDGFWDLKVVNEFQLPQTILLYSFTAAVLVGGGLSTPRGNVLQMALGYLATLLIIPIGHWMWNDAETLSAPLGVIPIAGLLAFPLVGRNSPKFIGFFPLMGCGTIVFFLCAFLIGGPFVAFIPSSIIYIVGLVVLLFAGPHKTSKPRTNANKQVG